MKFDCPHCHQNLSATEELYGIEMGCPSCQHKLTVPNPEVKETLAPTVKLREAAPINLPSESKASSPLSKVTHLVREKFLTAWSEHPKRVISLGLTAFIGLLLIGKMGGSSEPSLDQNQSAGSSEQSAIVVVREQARPQYQRCGFCKGSGIKGGRQEAAPMGSFAAHVQQLTGCRTCAGQGAIRTRSGHVATCPTCRGTGKEPPKPCFKCNGSGRLRVR